MNRVASNLAGVFGGAVRTVLGLGCLLLPFAATGLVIHSGVSGTGEVVIHVIEPDVLIEVDGQARRVDGPPSAPITVQLPGGLHTLRMTRDGAELYREDFRVEAGGSIVLTATKGTPAPLGRATDAPGPAPHRPNGRWAR